MESNWTFRLVVAALLAMAGCSGGGGSGTAAGGGKTVHYDLPVADCSYSLEAPEPLTPGDMNAMSGSLKSKSFSFTGFTGIMKLKGLALMELDRGNSHPVIFKGTANGVNLLVTKDAKKADEHAIAAMGEQVDAGGKQNGCAFLCSGVKEREAEVLEMCKSVRIKTVAAKPGP